MRAWAERERATAPPDPEPAVFPEVSERELRRLMWGNCGIVRDADLLTEAATRLEAVRCVPKPQATRADYELRNMHSVGRIIAGCALAREESRGGHFRSDFPEPREAFRKHSVITHRSAVHFD